MHKLFCRLIKFHLDNKLCRKYMDYSTGAVPKWLRGRSAKPLFIGSNPIGAYFFSTASMPRWWNLVDTRDLKSLGLLVRAGSSPALGTPHRSFQILNHANQKPQPETGSVPGPVAARLGIPGSTCYVYVQPGRLFNEMPEEYTACNCSRVFFG